MPVNIKDRFLSFVWSKQCAIGDEELKKSAIHKYLRNGANFVDASVQK
jgi:hypothetical protein